ncbi:hypothetical protein ACFPK9_00075 [Rubritalea spongiae]|uniref:hypothetical protein n=1 Tax=Rubritalea spongiae TaxID=430797 RepID=UPI003620FA9E
MLRRWRNEEAHLLSKLQCITITLLLHIIILGSIWANTANGSIFEIEIKGVSPAAMIAREALSTNKELIAATILSLYGIIGFASAILLQYIYTPNKFYYLAGLRNPNRSRNFLKNILADSGTGFPTSLSIAIITTIAWMIYAQHMQQSSTILALTSVDAWTAAKPLLLVVAMMPLLTHAIVLEHLGRQLTGIVAGFAWVLPLATGLLLNAWSILESFANFLYGFSPLAMNFSPGYVMASHTLSQHNQAFISGTKTGITLYFIIGIIFAILLMKRHKHFQTTKNV